MNIEIFPEITLIFVLTIVICAIIKALKQPLIIGYILSGIAVGPLFLNIIKSAEILSTFAQFGIAFLLFSVGLHLNPRIAKDIRKVSLITGIGQFLFTVIIGYFICKFLGFTTLTSIYISTALSFSSTIIIMKLLSDKRELETVYGRIATGFLLVQDFIAIFAIFILSSISATTNITELILTTFLKAVGLVLVLAIVSVYILPPITRLIARSQEFLLLFSVSWCFIVVGVFLKAHFSVEAGALLAGISLSLSQYQHEISSKIKPIRDFFVVLFFIVVGSQMIFANIGAYLAPAIILSLFVLIGDPLVVIILMSWLGYTRRNSFMAGLAVAQISEFSLVLVATGVSLGHVTKEILSLVTIVGLITIAGSSYMVIYADKIYPYVSRYLTVFERSGQKIDAGSYLKDKNHNVILFGYNRIGYDILKSLKKIKGKTLVIDHDPAVIPLVSRQGYDCIYGDANDIELLDEIDFRKMKMVISTIPSRETNLLIQEKVNEENEDCMFIPVSHEINEAEDLYDAGASYVILPHFLGGRHMSKMLEKYKMSHSKFSKERRNHLEHLAMRKQLHQDHPAHHR